jgi:hypothetical protein
MNFFPKRYSEIKTLNPVEKVLLNINNNNSEITHSLIIGRTGKVLKGYTEGTQFKVIGTEMPLGIFCVFKGLLIQKDNNTVIKLNSEFNKTFRILLCVWSILPIFAIINSLVQMGVRAILSLFPLIVLYVIIYLLINFLFKKSYENGIKDLKRIINQ